MKTLAAIALGLLASYLALVWVVGNLDAVSGAACSAEFTLPGIACRVGGLGLKLLLVPVAGIAVFLVVRRMLAAPRA